MYIDKKPINRSKLRLYLGKKYYTYKRYLNWYFGSKNYANEILDKKLECKIFEHSTPLIRKLQDVDMNLQYNKIINLQIASKRLNGVVIKPGETFSYWKLIGKPTFRKGYKEGLVLLGNGKFEAGVGGGLCQLSNLVYWMTLHTPLIVTERYRHSHDIFPDVNRTQPFGSGATCVYNYFDLQIFNNSNDIYQLVVYLTDDNLIGEWRCTKPAIYRYEVYEKNHSITTNFWGGYTRNNAIYRKIYNTNGELIKDEFVTENHAIMMYNPLIP